MAVRILRRLMAAQDAEDIANYIAKDRLDAAVRFLESVEQTLKDLAANPSSGGPFALDHPQLTNLRFRPVAGFPNHIIFYVEHKDAIEVVRILHGARDIEQELRNT